MQDSPQDDVHRVRLVTVNWDSAADGPDGEFSLLLVTEDGERHVVTPTPAATSTLIEMAQASSVLYWDSHLGVLIGGAIGPA